MITLSEIRALLNYNSATGVFLWRDSGGRGIACYNAGDVAGAPRSRDSYIKIGIATKRYYAHHLAWFYVYGKWPKMLDHIDRNKQNNSIRNLRETNYSTNAINAKAQVNNRLGVKGVRVSGNRYEARIAGDYLGLFLTIEEAKAAYLREAFNRYGEFAREFHSEAQISLRSNASGAR